MKPMLCKALDHSEVDNLLSNHFKPYMEQGYWIAQQKLDGDRIVLQHNSKTKLFNRREFDVAFRYPEIKLNVPMSVTLDGEMCVYIDGKEKFNEGISHRTHLQKPFLIQIAQISYPVTFMAFDILELNGTDLKGMPYKRRRALLEDFFETYMKDSTNIKIVPETTDINDLVDRTKENGSEGVILKNVNATYQEGKRSNDWIKIKWINETDLDFIKYESNNAGIRLEDRNENAVQCSGQQSHFVKQLIDKTGVARCTIRYMELTKDNRYRMPTFMKVVE